MATKMSPSPTEQLRTRVGQFMDRHRIGLLTLIFTDIAGSTGLKQELGDRVAVTLIQQHHALLRELLAGFPEAEEINTAGDSFFLVFTKPSDAVRFSLQLQVRLQAFAVETGHKIRDRIGIHVGEVFIELPDDPADGKDLFGIQVDTCGRLMGLAEPDQILLTRFAADNSRQVLKGHGLEEHGKVVWLNHSLYELKGVDEPLEVCEVGEVGVGVLAPPPDSEKAWRHRTGGQLQRAGWRPAAGETVPGTDWRLEEKLGEGGFGEVWRACGPNHDETAAFKFSFRSEGIALLHQAWKAAGVLQAVPAARAATAQVFAAHLEEPPHYLRQEFVPGRDLAAWCEEQGSAVAVPLAVRAELLAQLAEALAAAHRAGVVHGDLKPTNILISGDDPADLRVRLTDFGTWAPEVKPGPSARGTSFIGSPLYLAPEQAEETGSIGPAADIYAVGAIGYELLTGRPPFLRPSVAALLDAHRHEEPRLPCLEQPGVPDALQRICLKALEKQPADRYPSAIELARDLRRFMAGEPVLVRPSQYDNAIASRVRRHLRELGEWHRERLLTEAEYARLAGAYQRFDRAGLDAVLESRRIHAWLVALLLGGWLVLDGSSIWLKTAWETLGPAAKIAIGWLPVVVTNGLWVLLWKRGSLRGAYVMMLLGAVSLPFGLEVLLHAQHWFEVSVFNPSFDVPPIYNAQLLVVLPLAIGWAIFLMRRTRTLAIATLTTALVVLLYALVLDFGNLSQMAADQAASLAVCTMPLAFGLFLPGAVLARHQVSRRQAAPWFAGALLVLLLTTLALALNAADEWLASSGEDQPGLSRLQARPLTGLFLIGCGVLYLGQGLWLRRRFLVPARPAYLTLLWLAPVCVLGGITYAASNWPEGWPGIDLFGERMTLPDGLLFIASLGCIAAASLMQLRFFAVAGLTFLTLAEWRIAMLYFDSHRPAWAITLLVAGLALTAAVVAKELRHRRQRPWQEMDDTIELPRRPAG